MPVIPGIQEAEVGESLGPGRGRLRCAEIAPLYSSLGDRVETPSQKKNKKNKNTNKQTNKTIKITHLHYRIKKKSHMLVSTDGEKAFNKIQYPSCIKTLNELGMGENSLILIKHV